MIKFLRRGFHDGVNFQQARIEFFHDALDGPAFTGGIRAFDHDDDVALRFDETTLPAE